MLWIPIGERIGIGTVVNVILIGVVIDLTLFAIAWPFDGLVLRWSALMAGVLLVGIGSGFYIGVGLGPGPRDGLMTGIARRGYSIRGVRAVIEITVLVAGLLLGGTVGVGTVVFAFGIGPLVQLFLGRLTIPESSEAR